MIKKLDHLVITTGDINACLDFYTALGFNTKSADGRYELFAGDFKINVHVLGRELTPHAGNVQTGSADFCMEIEGDISAFKSQIEANGVETELGVVARTGVRGKMNSIYLRDPDGNLVEFCSYVEGE